MKHEDAPLPAADEGRLDQRVSARDPERAAFESWAAANGYSGLDDMLAPLDRSLKAMLWAAWQGCCERLRHSIYSAEVAQIEAPFRHELQQCADQLATLRTEIALAREIVQGAHEVLAVYRLPEEAIRRLNTLTTQMRRVAAFAAPSRALVDYTRANVL